jgi:hypothetical protein
MKASVRQCDSGFEFGEESNESSGKAAYASSNRAAAEYAQGLKTATHLRHWKLLL